MIPESILVFKDDFQSRNRALDRDTSRKWKLQIIKDYSLLVTITVVKYDVSLTLVDQPFYMWYASSGNTDQWVDVGLSCELNRKRSNS